MNPFLHYSWIDPRVALELAEGSASPLDMECATKSLMRALEGDKRLEGLSEFLDNEGLVACISRQNKDNQNLVRMGYGDSVSLSYRLGLSLAPGRKLANGTSVTFDSLDIGIAGYYHPVKLPVVLVHPGME